MRNGIVDMQNVELINLRHFRHARGQRQVIRRIFKQGVLRDCYLVKKNVRMVRAQADGLLVGNKVDLVSAGSKLNSQLRANHAAATVSWVACDSDFHAYLAFGPW